MSLASKTEREGKITDLTAEIPRLKNEIATLKTEIVVFGNELTNLNIEMTTASAARTTQKEQYDRTKADHDAVISAITMAIQHLTGTTFSLVQAKESQTGTMFHSATPLPGNPFGAHSE